MKNFQNLLKIYLNLLTNFNLNKKLINGRNFYQTKGAFESQIFLETQKAPWSLEYSKNADTNQYFLGNLQLYEAIIHILAFIIPLHAKSDNFSW